MESIKSQNINENIKVDDSNPNYTITYFKNFLSEIAESPVWHPFQEKFFWLDCYGSRIFTLKLPEQLQEINGHQDLSQSELKEYFLPKIEQNSDQRYQVSSIAPKPGSGFIASYFNHGFGTLDINEESGEVTVQLLNINPLEQSGNPNERFNDGKCSPEGRFFAGTCDIIEKSQGGFQNNVKQVFKVIGWVYKALRYNNITPYLYRLDGFQKGDKEKKATAIQEVGHVLISNGPTWSLDGSKFYFVCTIEGLIKEYDYDVNTGQITNPRVILEKNQSGGRLDGSTIDDQGNLWWAIFSGKKLIKVDPNQKKIVDQIVLKEFENPTSVAFGGKDYRYLFITSGENLIGRKAGGFNGGIAIIQFNQDAGVKGLPPAVWKDESEN